MKHQTREEWLAAAVKQMEPLFQSKDYAVPAVRVSCGWPHRGGTAKAKRVLGQCWAPESAEDGVHQIFISPYLAKEASDFGVLATLVHEVVHTVVGLPAKHGKKFSKCAKAVGLEGKMTATNAGPELLAHFDGWLKELGNYPHASLDLRNPPTKKQGTRMIKCECPECKYSCRTTKKWLDEAGAPYCPAHPKHGSMMFELPEPTDEDAGE